MAQIVGGEGGDAARSGGSGDRGAESVSAETQEDAPAGCAIVAWTQGEHGGEHRRRDGNIFCIRTRPEPGGRYRVVAIELKSRFGRVRPDQRIWIRLLAAAGIEVYTWPAGVDTLEDIARVLR